ncbi:MAG TPA: ATP-binding protein [Solirubrobacterales bacterium]|nr:ATP-binding protein [Solirubrobacterales bacterium]
MAWRLPRLKLAGEPPPAWLGLAAALGAVAAATLLVYPLKSVAPVVSLGVVYLPAILLLSIVWGLRLGLATSVLSAVAFNFFHLPPLHRFTIAEEGNWVALATFALAAAISSAVAELARSQALDAERRRQEADRAKAELEELARERDRMQAEAIEAEALRRSDELKTALLRSVSHDLRTPLTSVIAAGAALGSPTLTEMERSELSQAVVGEGNRLSRLVENLLDLSRIEAGKAEPHREPADLVETLEAARESAGLDPQLARIAAESDLPLLSADATQLERAFANLLENGVRHGGGRPVQARCRRVGAELVVRIVDRGPGIPVTERERIFEAFHRIAGGEPGGSGLGLAIAKGFVEANGGRIAVESLPHQGTTFVVSFPVAAGGAQ